MKICFVCKYPPIEGGVSMHGYWSARGLAQKGHQVFVVTNANEVESEFRLRLSKDDLERGGPYASEFPETSGFVKVYSTEPPDRSLYYIPFNNPAVTRLATIATNIIRTENCKVIFAYYFEPYGMSAHLASSWTGVPYVLKHAGSDLHNLALLPELQTAYVEVMHAANRVISSGPSRVQLLSYGIPAERIASAVSFKLPTAFFKADGPALDLTQLSREFNEPEYSLAPFEEPLPKLGIYGKLGEYKGSFDLLEAMASLLRNGFRWAEPPFRRRIEALGLTKYVKILTFLPHWRVPEFIRSCTAITFLERDFPIGVHGPTIPTEAITCGKCVIISEEVARKQPYRSRMRNFHNIVIVPDPKQHETLAACIRFALEDSVRAEEIGRRGLAELSILQDHEGYLDRLESLLLQVADETTVSKTGGPTTETPEDLLSMVSRLYPFTYELLTESQKRSLVEEIDPNKLTSNASNDLELPLALGSQMLSALAGATTPPDAAGEVCRYEYLMYQWRHETDRQLAKQTSRMDFPFSKTRIGPLYPHLKDNVAVVEFSHDVQVIIDSIRTRTELPSEKRPLRLLICPGSRPSRINDSTHELLNTLKPGSMTTDEVLTKISTSYNSDDGPAAEQLKDAFHSMLETLYWEGLIDFRPAARHQIQ